MPDIKILNLISTVMNNETVPEAFCRVVESLALVQGILRATRERIRTDFYEEVYQMIETVVRTCKVKAEHLNAIFHAVATTEGIFMLERYRAVARRLGKGNEVEVLAMEMLQDMRFLVENRAVQTTTEASDAQIDEAIEYLPRVPPSMPDESLIHSVPVNECMDNYGKYISIHFTFGNTFSSSGTVSNGTIIEDTVTWVHDVQRAVEIHPLIWELPWFEQSSRPPVRLPWNPCVTKDCVLPNGHLSSHEVWKPCTIEDCSRHQGHGGDHIMRSEELSEINARFEKRAKAAQMFWRELADTVLEAMGYPQPEDRWRSKMARTIIKPFENTRRKPLIQSASLPRGIPSSPYRKFVLENRQIRLFQLDPATTTSITGSFICAELSSRPANIHERNHEVGLMRQIYNSAAKVYVWLGQEDESSDIAMRFVVAQASKPLRPRGSGYHALWSRREGKALHALCDRRYWRRMWIIQELLHANDITVWCGSLNFSWDDIEKLYLKLKTIEESHWFAHHARGSSTVHLTPND
ncbi:Pfs NACHT and ankyrin domain protein [Fusarium subglutinans]|uniref:Pfs NACHT and ankyrin domain protein n=1 Tax=Gibberella subglutinans TaxID=42677 RepID=A0A8H5PF77_GIBSU|nr:Pfs NACHT and ankyrin domain protein [Fusarium subglutinans]KAF5595298.1 Pfs NACHT and ankyrin domain protein [Fusarium subglutinans]